MWECDCTDKGRYPSGIGTFREVDVMGDGRCVICNHYAIWTEDRLYKDTPQVFSVFAVEENTSPLYFNNAEETFTFINASAPTRNEFLASQKTHAVVKGFLVIVGKVTTLSEKHKQLIFPVVRAFNKQGDIVAEASTVAKVSSMTGESIGAIYSNIQRRSFFTKKNLVYTDSSSFCIKTYLINKSFSFDDPIQLSSESLEYEDHIEDLEYCNRYVG